MFQLLQTMPDDQLVGAIHNPRWAAQRKYDGHRFQLRGGQFISRGGHDKTTQLMHIVDEMRLSYDLDKCTFDGEIICGDNGTASDVTKYIQRKDGKPCINLQFAIFDVLKLHGEVISVYPFSDRSGFIDGIGHRFSYFGVGVFAEPSQLIRERMQGHWEGMVLKRTDHPYHPQRHWSWVKAKMPQLRRIWGDI